MLSPYELAHSVINVSHGKINRRFLKVLVSSMLAGLFIGLGYYANIIISSNLGLDAGLNKFLGGFIFSVGIVMVIIAGADLFTGNCLIMFGVFDKKVKFSNVVIHLLIVLLGNLLGSLFLVFLIYFSKMPSEITIEYIEKISTAKLSLGFGEAIFRGILCNILVAIGVYMAYAAKDISGKVIAAVLPVAAFVVMGFEHSVANMFILPLSYMYQNISIFDILFNNLIPVILGNFIGGGIILPLAYYYLYIKD